MPFFPRAVIPLYSNFFSCTFKLSDRHASFQILITRRGGDNWKRFEINESFEREREREVVRIIRSNSRDPEAGDFTKFLRLSRGEQVQRTVALGYPRSQFVAKVSREPRGER